jgi:curved DNA-binding protein
MPTLDRPIALKIPPRTQTDRTFRVKGKGMPRLGNPGDRGDLYVRIKLTLPEPLSDQEADTIRELAASRKNRHKT